MNNRCNRRQFMCALGAGALSLISPLPLQGKSKKNDPPNFLFIAVDDLRTSLGCYGDKIAKTPHIDALAKSGLVFSRAYCQQAVCGPSRAAILTGLLPDHTRVWHNRNLFRDTVPDTVTMPELFKNNGYHTQSLGKIFSGRTREDDPQSWSVPSVLIGKGWKNYILPENQGSGKQSSTEKADVPDEGYRDGRLAKLAVETLENLKQKDQPFFLGVGFFKPHLPFNAPKKYWDLYDPAVFEQINETARVKNAPDVAYHSHRELGGYRDMPRDEKVSMAQARQLQHGYYACVSYIDAQAGKVLNALKRLGLDKNTIVVLWGDHGYALAEQDRWCKGTNFELDTRVPLIVRAPGITDPGVTTNALIEYVDIYPTLAQLAGLSAPNELDGRSIAAVLENPRLGARKVVLSQFTRPFKKTTPKVMGYSIRTNTHRYTRWFQWPSRKILAEELYDYAFAGSVVHSSPYLIEKENVIDNPDYIETRKQLSKKMDKMLKERNCAGYGSTP